MKVDLHMHARERSGCSVSGTDQMIQAARAAGLDGMAFSDHDRLVPSNEMDALRRQNSPFRLFTSIEVTTCEGEHVLVIGLPDRSLETKRWTYEELHRFTGEHRAYMVLAHPYRFHDPAINVEKFPPDAIELYSGNIREEIRPRIRQLIDRIGCAAVYFSDAHHVDRIGRYFIDLDEPVATDQALVDVLKRRAFHLPSVLDGY